MATARESFLTRLEEVGAEQHRSRAKRMEELMPEIDLALGRGISRNKILEALRLEGIEVTASTLSNYVRRYRKRLENAGLRAPDASPSETHADADPVSPGPDAQPETP
jgi:hypothetical protein